MRWAGAEGGSSDEDWGGEGDAGEEGSSSGLSGRASAFLRRFSRGPSDGGTRRGSRGSPADSVRDSRAELDGAGRVGSARASDGDRASGKRESVESVDEESVLTDEHGADPAPDGSGVLPSVPRLPSAAGSSDAGGGLSLVRGSQKGSQKSSMRASGKAAPGLRSSARISASKLVAPTTVVLTEGQKQAWGERPQSAAPPRHPPLKEGLAPVRSWAEARCISNPQEIQRAFEAFDEDGSGTMDFSELRIAMSALGFAVSDDEMEALRKEVAEDGIIEFELFTQIMTARYSDIQAKADNVAKFQVLVRHSAHFR